MHTRHQLSRVTLGLVVCAATALATPSAKKSRSNAPADCPQPTSASRTTATPAKPVVWAGTKWYPLAQARKLASSPRRARPIVYLRLLGDLVGKT